MTRDAIIVPLKRFDRAKDRLRSAGSKNVSALAEELARGVLAHCAPRHVIIVSESGDIAEFARQLGCEVWRSPARNLNEAVQNAYDGLSPRFDQLIVVHGDLVAPEGIGLFAPEPGVTIVTDRHERGTNVLALPTHLDFHFAYGADSALLHQREAQRLGVACGVITGSPWGHDIDEPDDLQVRPDGI